MNLTKKRTLKELEIEFICLLMFSQIFFSFFSGFRYSRVFRKRKNIQQEESFNQKYLNKDFENLSLYQISQYYLIQNLKISKFSRKNLLYLGRIKIIHNAYRKISDLIFQILYEKSFFSWIFEKTYPFSLKNNFKNIKFSEKWSSIFYLIKNKFLLNLKNTSNFFKKIKNRITYSYHSILNFLGPLLKKSLVELLKFNNYHSTNLSLNLGVLSNIVHIFIKTLSIFGDFFFIVLSSMTNRFYPIINRRLFLIYNCFLQMIIDHISYNNLFLLISNFIETSFPFFHEKLKFFIASIKSMKFYDFNINNLKYFVSRGCMVRISKIWEIKIIKKNELSHLLNHSSREDIIYLKKKNSFSSKFRL